MPVGWRWWWLRADGSGEPMITGEVGSESSSPPAMPTGSPVTGISSSRSLPAMALSDLMHDAPVTCPCARVRGLTALFWAGSANGNVGSTLGHCSRAMPVDVCLIKPRLTECMGPLVHQTLYRHTTSSGNFFFQISLKKRNKTFNERGCLFLA